MERLTIGSEDSEACTYAEALATLLALVGSEVELSVTAQARPSRQLVSSRGALNAGPELGTDEDALIPFDVGGVQLALKAAWLECAWRELGGASLALLFEGGVLVELDRVADHLP